MMQRVPMTLEGAQALQDELQKLKKQDRPNVVKAIAEARAHGDLKENAEYHAAREQQSFIEGRIKSIEAKLSVAQIIDVAKLPKDGRVVFGVTVSLYNLETEEEITYKLVGDDESDLSSGKISINSPIARALIGKNEGDCATVQTPKGPVEYEIVEVKYL